MGFRRCLLVAAVWVAFMFGGTHAQENNDVLFQISTINALLEGIYDGEITCAALRQHGDFGIGTFEALDGEMVGLGGKFYQIKVDGKAYPVADPLKTPFAVVTFFEPDKTTLLEETVDYGDLEQYLDSLLPTENIFHALKIEGLFNYVKTRSVRRQNRPYPPLVEAVKNQSTFEFRNVRGTIVGFRCPGYVSGINVPGYHLHFITEDRQSGGHLLECQPTNVKIEIDYTAEFYLALPESGAFGEADLAQDRETELEKVEK